MHTLHQSLGTKLKMLNVKQCDVTPIIVQCAKDCNKKFDVNQEIIAAGPKF